MLYTESKITLFTSLLFVAKSTTQLGACLLNSCYRDWFSSIYWSNWCRMWSWLFNIYIFAIKEYELLFKLLSNFTEIYNHRVIIVGDNFFTCITSKKLQTLIKFLIFCEYKQYNFAFNTKNRYLDLVISNFIFIALPKNLLIFY